jgi:uncharacterized membrane protein
VSLYEWLLGVHITGAFLLVGGIVVTAVFNVWAGRTERPSDVALYLRLQMVGVVGIGIGALLTLVIGLWLVHEANYGYGEFWVWAAVLLWIVAMAAGNIGGRSQATAAALATRLAAEGDAPSAELRAAVRDPRASTLFVVSGLSTLLVLVLMIWKPGA